MFLERSVFKMYVKTGCPFCDKAREIILKDLNCSLHLIDVTHQPDLRELVIADTGQKTVPVVYLGDEFIGGCDDLVKLCEEGIENRILREEVNILKEEVRTLRRGL
jgi:glutaredoxin 3